MVLLFKIGRKDVTADSAGRAPEQQPTAADPAVVLLLRMVRTELTADSAGRASEQQPTLADPGGVAFESCQKRNLCRSWWSCS